MRAGKKFTKEQRDTVKKHIKIIRERLPEITRTQIADQLNLDGLTTANGQPWTVASVHNFLSRHMPRSGVRRVRNLKRAAKKTEPYRGSKTTPTGFIGQVSEAASAPDEHAGLHQAAWVKAAAAAIRPAPGHIPDVAKLAMTRAILTSVSLTASQKVEVLTALLK